MAPTHTRASGVTITTHGDEAPWVRRPYTRTSAPGTWSSEVTSVANAPRDALRRGEVGEREREEGGGLGE